MDLKSSFAAHPLQSFHCSWRRKTAVKMSRTNPPPKSSGEIITDCNNLEEVQRVMPAREAFSPSAFNYGVIGADFINAKLE